jgi:hypothetical protein
MTFGLQCDEASSRDILDRAAVGASRSSTHPTSTPSAAASRPSGAPRRSSGAGSRADKRLDHDLKARLDDLTREYRWGDDIR